MKYFVWDVSPILFKMGPVIVSWYGLFFFGSFIVGAFIISRWIFKREGHSLNMLYDLLFYSIIGTLVGARLMHFLAYQPEFFFSNPMVLVKVWIGGLASHGGMLGLLIALWLVAKKYDKSFLWLISRMTMSGFVVAFSVRLGNFFNSEILGNITDVPWAVVFPRVDNLPRHPVQLYEAIAYMILFIVFVMLYRKISSKLTTNLFPGLFLFSMFTARFLLEFTKSKQEEYTWILPFNTGQMLSLPFILIGIVWIIWAVIKTRNETKYSL